jgi:hypothetical protein
MVEALSGAYEIKKPTQLIVKARHKMRKHLTTATIILLLASVGTMLSPITSDAKSPKMMTVHTPSGKTVQLRTMKIGGQMMILVPMSMACDVFHVYC